VDLGDDLIFQHRVLRVVGEDLDVLDLRSLESLAVEGDGQGRGFA
jgi:hypothetical protein